MKLIQLKEVNQYLKSKGLTYDDKHKQYNYNNEYAISVNHDQVFTNSYYLVYMDNEQHYIIHDIKQLKETV